MLQQLAWPLVEESLLPPPCVLSCSHIEHTNGSSSPSPSLHPFAVLSLMDRWHPIVYWAKVQCLIGHSSGNWASVYAWPSLNLPPKKGGEEGRRRKRGSEGVGEWAANIDSCSKTKWKKKKEVSPAMGFLAFCFDLSAPGVCISVCAFVCCDGQTPPPHPPRYFLSHLPVIEWTVTAPIIYTHSNTCTQAQYSTRALGLEVISWWWGSNQLRANQ